MKDTSNTQKYASEEPANRALDRGLVILETLGKYGSCDLARLHKITKLPKSTINRALKTLVARRFVRRSLNDGMYRINIRLPETYPEDLPVGASSLILTAAPIVEELTAETRWPSDVFVRDDAQMRVVESSRSCSPLCVNRSELGLFVDIAFSASGRAYLSHCPDAEREMLLKKVAEKRWAPPTVEFDMGAIREVLELTRKRGFSERDPAYKGVSVPDDGLRVIACPIMVDERVLGAISFMWPLGFMEVERFAANNFGRLRAAAHEIGARMAEKEKTVALLD